jgi:hypothetical protein
MREIAEVQALASNAIRGFPSKTWWRSPALPMARSGHSSSDTAAMARTGSNLGEN